MKHGGGIVVNIETCPKCKNVLDNGYISAPGVGITWKKDRDKKLLVGSDVENFQRLFIKNL